MAQRQDAPGPNPPAPGDGYGRVAVLAMLAVLLLTVAWGVYLYNERHLAGLEAVPGAVGVEAAARAEERVHRLTLLIMVVLVSGLLILLFLLGSYLVLRVGRAVRQPIGGRRTAYFDAWRHYRLTPEQIAQATAETDDDSAGPPGERSSDNTDPPRG